ncbi:ABC transporter ATP-binding protein [Peribacillus psychrosaccharolyticus]|uniref:ABC transporter ATP-binding protein n=2 Tax=Peribacillus psychrosaccharolyticus TaxID=1407 RepID=A0A974S0W7_PERPY|nr:ABC transporter ATP-binding protein [Peribacillus psychrosaccharolyticus]MEC2057320.1 ABC transporter ATP-binding protein [Peribacillus psychrosaccharolyticus]QQT01077.1 ABC transporter ATP-binding protein [Peribacillus psychrosaccharolyticus]
MTSITVKSLSFYYKKEDPILTDISLTFDQRTTAIIGQNGAGKTTLVKLLKGLLKPASGEIWINDQDTRVVSVAKLAGYIGLVFQNPNDQIFKSKVIDEVMFGPLNVGQPKEEAITNSMNALLMVGMEDKKDDHPYDLSLSERKLISIASIIAMNTDIVIFDEPTIAQDYAGKETIKRVIHDLQKKGKWVITIIHDMDFVAETFARTIVLANGKILLDGTTREIFLQKDVLVQAGLNLPHVTQLGYLLEKNKTVLTIDEFIKDSKL